MYSGLPHDLEKSMTPDGELGDSACPLSASLFVAVLTSIASEAALASFLARSIASTTSRPIGSKDIPLKSSYYNSKFARCTHNRLHFY